MEPAVNVVVVRQSYLAHIKCLNHGHMAGGRKVVFIDEQPDIQEIATSSLFSSEECGESLYQAGIHCLYVNNEPKRAFTYFKKGALKGSIDASLELAAFYHDGKGVTKNIKLAKKHFKLAADNGCMEAQYQIAHIYYGEKDYTTCAHYTKLSAQQNHADAQALLGNLYHKAIGVPRNLDRAIQNYLPKASEGNMDVQYCLAHCYLEKKEYQEALKYFELAALQGHQKVHLYLAELLIGDYPGVQKNIEKGIEHLELGCTFKNSKALAKLGFFYLEGIHVQKDEKRAIQLFWQAAKLGEAGAWENLGTIYHEGIAVKEDISIAFSCYNKAADLGARIAQYNMGVYYAEDSKGEGRSRDLDKAIEYMVKAAKQGVQQAIDALPSLYLQKAYYLSESKENYIHALAYIEQAKSMKREDPELQTVILSLENKLALYKDRV